MRLTIELERASDGGWSGSIDAMPGLLLMGDTIDKLLASAPQAIGLYLEDSGQEFNGVVARAVSLEIDLRGDNEILCRF